MSKIILSGDLGRFRPEMLIRILESVKADAILTLEGVGTGQITLLQGKIVGAAVPPAKGLDALKELVVWNSGTFTVRDISATTTHSLVRSPDLMSFPDNASLFRALVALRRSGAPEGVPAAAGAAAPRPAGAAPAPVGASPTPARPSTGNLMRSTINGPKIGPLAKVPHLTDKGKSTVKSLQQNFARGVTVDEDKWRVLMKIDNELPLFNIGEEIRVMGERLMRAVKELQEEGLIAFDSIDQAAAQRLTGNFKFGEYMVAKGHITQLQLESALQRQQELARKGRYMWLGEILVEMNYVRPGQVQEALGYQKRKKR